MGKTFANTFGKIDSNATNGVLNGGVVATGTAGAKTVADPLKGLTSAQARNRKLLSLGAGTVGDAMNQQPQAQAPPVNFNTQGVPQSQNVIPAPLQFPFYGRMPGNY